MLGRGATATRRRPKQISLACDYDIDIDARSLIVKHNDNVESEPQIIHPAQLVDE